MRGAGSAMWYNPTSRWILLRLFCLRSVSLHWKPQACCCGAFDRREFEGRRLRVNEARPQERRSGGFNGPASAASRAGGIFAARTRRSFRIPGASLCGRATIVDIKYAQLS
jgi:hypothetical protein